MAMGESGQDQSVATKRAARSDRGAVRMTGRDLEALTWLAQQWGAPMTQVGQLLRGKDTAVDKRLYSALKAVQRWRTAGWVDTARVDSVTGLWVFPRPALSGQLLGWTCPPWRPSVHRAVHCAVVNGVRLDLAGSSLAGWRSERELLHEAGFRAPGERMRMPDGVWLGGGVRLVEVEWSLKSAAGLREMVRGWPEACARWGASGVSVLCRSQQIVDATNGALEGLRSEFPEMARAFDRVDVLVGVLECSL